MMVQSTNVGEEAQQLTPPPREFEAMVQLISVGVEPPRQFSARPYSNWLWEIVQCDNVGDDPMPRYTAELCGAEHRVMAHSSIV